MATAPLPSAPRRTSPAEGSRPRAAAAAWRVLVGLVVALAGCADATIALPDGLEVVAAELRDVSPRLSELAKRPSPAPGALAERAREANPPRRITAAATRAAAAVDRVTDPVADPVLQRAAGTGSIPAPIANFEGLGTGLDGFIVQSAPPDTVGDIGPNHYVQVVNFSLAVFSRTGALVLGPVETRRLWDGFGGACATTNDGDATVRYDRIARRWVIGQFSVNGGQGPFYQCVAVSTSDDPTGSYNRYQFSFAAFNDYPKMALWPNAYYFTFNLFQNNEFTGSKLCAMDRAKMLAGGAATMHCFRTTADYGGLLAADLDGAAALGKKDPTHLVAFGTNELLLWKMHADFLAPINSYFTGPVSLPVAPFAPLCTDSPCVRQPGTAQGLDSLGDRLMNRAAYRRLPTHESLVVSHAVQAAATGGVRWYELRDLNGTPTVYQQGTYAPDSSYRFMSSIAMDGVGNIAMGYANASSALSPGIRYTGRLTNDPLGTMGQGEGTLVAGFGAQTGGLSRYGDYSSLTVDPVDDCTFWYTQEYIGATGSFNWRTRVGSFRFASCGNAGDDFTLTADPTSAVVAPGASQAFTVTATLLSGAGQTIRLTLAGLPTGVTGAFVPPTINASGTSTLTLTAAATTPTTAAQISVIGSTPSAVHSASIALSVVRPAAAPAAEGAPALTADAPLAPAGTAELRAGGLPLEVPDNHGGGVTSTLDVALAGDVEHAALSLELRHPYRGDLEVTLVAPGGEQYAIVQREGGDARDLRLAGRALPELRGQPAAGRWSLRVRDRASGDRGTLLGWSLQLTTRPRTPPRWAALGPKALPLIDHGERCSALSAWDDAPAASARVELTFRHDHAAALRATLRHGGIVVPLFEVGAFPGRGGTFSLRRALPTMPGAAAGAWTLCLEDVDGFGDTGELVSWSVSG
ncbi:MAG: proprotein convertase P-domain-containing protein [Kofleriaceae bacterium]